MRAADLQDALCRLSDAIHEVERTISTLKTEHDPLALHIFAARRRYRLATDTKGGKRRETAALLSYNQACELGFRGSLDEWNRLMGASPKR